MGFNCAWHFEDGLWFGRILQIGTKKGAHGVIPVQKPVPLTEPRSDSIVVSCHYYERVPAEEIESLKVEHGLRSSSVHLYRIGSVEHSSKSCE